MKKIIFTVATNSLDADGDIISPSAFQKVNGDRVPLTRDFDPSKVLGFARVKKEGNKLIADAEISDTVHSDCILELYPAIGFRSIRSHIDGNGNRGITYMKLYEVSLSDTPNVDHAVKKLKDQ